MDWLKKHVDTVIIMGGILSSFLYMQNKFAHIEKDIIIVKTVLIMRNIMPSELAKEESK